MTARRRTSFASTDLSRALKGALRAGMKVSRAEIENGKIVIVFDDPDTEPETVPLDEWRARRGANSN